MLVDRASASTQASYLRVHSPDGRRTARWGRAANEVRAAEPVVGGRMMLESEARVYVEPWPAGGWAVWLQDHAAPLSRHDTRDEAEFRAVAYRRVLKRGHRLAFNAAEHVVRSE